MTKAPKSRCFCLYAIFIYILISSDKYLEIFSALLLYKRLCYAIYLAANCYAAD